MTAAELIRILQRVSPKTTVELMFDRPIDPNVAYDVTTWPTPRGDDGFIVTLTVQ